ncbi:MAG: OmpA family protein [Planctomycetota bacterium]|nr:OmpA family protein [Planctomycetota bacterium]MDG2142648.1 OmpA family protein [Planctomycetota bacterium]
MRPIRLIGTLVACLAATSCISQAKYDEAVDTAQLYQRQAHDSSEYIAQLQAENAGLRTSMEQRPAMEEGVIDAAYTADIDERLASLQGLLHGMGRGSDQVTVLDVEGGYGFSVSDSVLFTSGSAAISTDGQALLINLAGSIAQGDFQRIWIRGHSDSDKVTKPSTLERFPHGNLQLSSDRALEVAALLANRGGLPMSKMAIAGLGSSMPVASNDTPEGKSSNRRVELFIIEDSPAAK